MISFNLYDKAIHSLTNFFEEPKKNFFFLLNLSLGILLGIVFFSNILSFFITNYYAYTTSIFIGLILGGLPIIFTNISKKKTNYLIITLTFILMTILSISGINNNYIPKNNYYDTIIYFVSGLLEAIGTIIPGISSTALLMLIGVYNIFLNILSNLLNISSIINNLSFLIPFSLGLLIGIIIISLLINYLFKNYKSSTFSLILGVSISSLFLLFVKVLLTISSLKMLVFSLILMVIGYFITRKIS